MNDLLEKRKSEQLRIDPRRRYRRLFLNSFFASSGFVAWILLLLIVGGSAAFAALFGIVPVQNAFLLACASVIAFSLWLFTYAALYIPTRPAPVTVADVLQPNSVDHNLADAASYSLLILLGKSFHSGKPDEVRIFIQRIVRTRSVQSMLRRLEIKDADFMTAFDETIAAEVSWESLASMLGTYLGSAGRMYVKPVDIIAALLVDKAFRVWLRHLHLQESDVQFMAWWQHEKDDADRARARWWSVDHLLGFTGVGVSWAAGYTPFVDQFARIPHGSAWDVDGVHQKSLTALINTLARGQQANVLLVGQPGVGRLGVVRELMRRVAAGTAHPALKNQRVLYIHISQLTSLGSTPQAQSAIVARALSEMERAGNIIVVFDGLGSILGGESGIDLTDLLVPFLSSTTVRVVTLLSTENYHQMITGKQELERVFEVVEVPPLSGAKTLQLLALSIEGMEARSGVYVTYGALKEIVTSTSSILPHIPFPEKAFDILEELITTAAGAKQQHIVAADVDTLITQKVGVNIGQLKAEEGVRLASLPELIHRRVINQEEGIQAVSRAMVRARAGVRNQNKPIGSFLFLGPTGVGKTETAKALAETYFGSTRYLQRLDMSEFQTDDAIGKLIGTTKQPVGRLLNTVSSHPFCVLLLDEFEKASSQVQQLFLPLFDEGYLTDAHGRSYSFVHTIIIATSNAGSELIRSSVTANASLPEGFADELREHILSTGIFLPELLNRFDDVITFTPLTAEHTKQVAHLMLISLNKRLDAKHGVTVRVTDELVVFLVEHGYDPQFGARPMRRLIQDTVEYEAARQIIGGTVDPGQEIVITTPALKALLK